MSSIQWASSLDEAQSRAGADGKYVLLDFFNPL